MTLDPFKRLTLLAAAGLAIFLLVLVDHWYGRNAAVFVCLGAVAVTVLASIERREDAPLHDPTKPTVRFGGPPPGDDE